MQKSLILAEKPSQAHDLAAGLGQFQKRAGYLENQTHKITWAFGHLVSLEPPDAYDKKYKTWTTYDLPIIPGSFKYKVGESGAKQFHIIKTLIHNKDIEKIVICTDPGREGELIARLILRIADNKKPVFRFWTSKALTPEAVREGFAELKPSAEFDRLYESALARQQADWIVGMNVTRVFTVKMNALYSLGRVQTPVLSIIVNREHEIKNFKSGTYWVLKAKFLHENGDYEGVWYSDEEVVTNADKKSEKKKEDTSIRIDTEDSAKQINERIAGKTGIIEACKQQLKTDPPPLLFSLTILQQEANRLYGFPAAKTLKIAQELYETGKAISYPRTESQHLNPELAKDMMPILNNLKKTSVDFDINQCTVIEKNKRIFDSSKLTDHHALIPTGQIPKGLSIDESKLYDLVVRRFVSAFYPANKYKTTTIITIVDEDRFKTLGKVVTVKGWKAIYGTKEKEQILPTVKEKDPTILKETGINKKKTNPPIRYTDATILSAMTNAQRFITDKKLKAILRETSGLGTPATRASILEVLENRKYVVRQKKNIVPTQKGMSLIEIVKNEKIADPSYTAVWEQTLDEIANGKTESSEYFMTEIKEYAAEIVQKVKNMDLEHEKKKSDDKEEIGKCPECKKSVYENKLSYYCSGYREGCKFSVWKNGLKRLGKKNITLQEAKDLIDGKLIVLKGLKSKTGKTFDAKGKLKKHEKYGHQINLVF